MTTSDSPEWDIPLHRPAMVRQVLEYLQPSAGQRALDVTAGTGGHSLALARRLGADGLLVAMDRDEGALEVARERLEEADCPFRLFKGSFTRAAEAAERADVDGFDAVLADLGIGTHQMDDPERGFSYRSTAKLDMRYDRSQRLTAREVVNREPEDSLADIFWELGEERKSRQIARAIVRRRDREPIDTPAELAELIEDVAARGGGEWRIHPATRV
ncbi:MAG: 16S rRNA (cytosine(1402)-N(4))-methyltransferase RsmH, partial [Planctomycetota bacterium]